MSVAGFVGLGEGGELRRGDGEDGEAGRRIGEGERVAGSSDTVGVWRAEMARKVCSGTKMIE